MRGGGGKVLRWDRRERCFCRLSHGCDEQIRRESEGLNTILCLASSNVLSHRCRVVIPDPEKRAKVESYFRYCLQNCSATSDILGALDKLSNCRVEKKSLCPSTWSSPMKWRNDIQGLDFLGVQFYLRQYQALIVGLPPLPKIQVIVHVRRMSPSSLALL